VFAAECLGDGLRRDRSPFAMLASHGLLVLSEVVRSDRETQKEFVEVPFMKDDDSGTLKSLAIDVPMQGRVSNVVDAQRRRTALVWSDHAMAIADECVHHLRLFDDQSHFECRLQCSQLLGNVVCDPRRCGWERRPDFDLKASFGHYRIVSVSVSITPSH
jgi:hypothetical protein